MDAGGVGSPYLRKNHPFPLFLSSFEGGAGDGSDLRSLMNETLAYNAMDYKSLPGKISPHLAHCVRGG